MLEDIATLSGGQVTSEDLGIKLENVTVDMLGGAKRMAHDQGKAARAIAQAGAVLP